MNVGKSDHGVGVWVQEKLERDLAEQLRVKDLALKRAEDDERVLAGQRDEATAEAAEAKEAWQQAEAAAKAERAKLLQQHKASVEEAKREAEANAAAERERAANAHQARVAALEKHLERERAEREASTKSADEQLAALRAQASIDAELYKLGIALNRP